MKKLLLIMLAFTTGNMLAQSKASESVAINAEIVSPISIESEGVINFGRIASTAEGGQVFITPEGERSASSENMLLPGEGSTAVFLVKAADGYAYSVAVEADPLTNGTAAGAQSMNVEFKSTQDKLTGNGQEQEIGISSSLTVNPAQAPGEYSGKVKMTVSYE